MNTPLLIRGEFRYLLQVLFLFVPLVIVPQLLPKIKPLTRNNKDPLFWTAATFWQPIASIIVALSFLFTNGVLSALLASAWLLQTFFLACVGISRLLPRGTAPIEELSVDFGLLYVFVGGIWLVISRSGLMPLGFGQEISMLTVIHFHYAAFSGLVLSGLLGGMFYPLPKINKLYKVSIISIIFAVPLVALGIAFSFTLEIVGASALICGYILFALLLLYYAARYSREHWRARILLTLSSLSLLFAMGVVSIYTWQRLTHAPTFAFPTIVASHGVANAFGFIFLGLLATYNLKSLSRYPRYGIPFSKIAGYGRIGSDFFERIGALEMPAAAPCGLVDRFDDFAQPTLPPLEIHPNIKAFYEKTKEFDLIVVPSWHWVFRMPALLYRRLANSIGQMCLPVSTVGTERLIRSEILKIKDQIDGRNSVRAWLRTYDDSKFPLYIAAYSSHCEGKVNYMNIAFPLPGGNLTSILKPHAFPVAGSEWAAFELTTLSNDGQIGDQGVYFSTRLFTIRLPLHETIRVWAADMENSVTEKNSDAVTVARHELWLFGIKYLTLDYSILPKANQLKNLS